MLRLYHGCIRTQRSKAAGPHHTLTTVAVRPAAEELLPLVYTARGRKADTYLQWVDSKGVGQVVLRRGRQRTLQVRSHHAP